eukprot:symbB.v1.2.010842.t1/scaffold717.1/size169572/4
MISGFPTDTLQLISPCWDQFARRIPQFGDPLGGDRMLGFGDIALPGLLVSFLRRHDILSHKKIGEGYFLPSLVGYFVGLCATIVALTVMKMGQPALLYLVPCTLGLTVLLSLCRGELMLLWDNKVSRRGSEVKWVPRVHGG